jgi:hypothetical protein
VAWNVLERANYGIILWRGGGTEYFEKQLFKIP